MSCFRCLRSSKSTSGSYQLELDVQVEPDSAKMKAALRKASINSPEAVRRRRISDGIILAAQHERLEVPERLARSNTVDIADTTDSPTPGGPTPNTMKQGRSRSKSPIETIPEEGEMPAKRVPRFRKHSNIDIPRSRSPSPVPPHLAEQAAILQAQAIERNNNSPDPSPTPNRKLAPSLSITSPDGTTGTSDASNSSNSCSEEEETEEEKTTVKMKKSAEKLRHVIDELVDTEIAYGKDLEILMTRFLTPLKRAALLPDEDVDALISNIKDIWEFQSVFSQIMEDARQSDPNYASLENTNDFRRMVFTIGSAFLKYPESFNLYSTFCAVHSKAEKLLRPSPKKGNDILQEFLESRRVSAEAGTAKLGIQSYIIKPMQRILKYPLLIREMKARFDPDCDTYHHLGVALQAMQKVANHINDMMRVHEQYGTVFESLLAANVPKDKKGKASMVTELNMDDLVMYSTATWHNYVQDLGKDRRSSIKKDPEITVLLFNNAVVLVCKVKTRVKRRSVVDFIAASQPTDDDGVSFKRLIPIADLQVKDTEDDAEGMNLFRWELTHSNTTDTIEDKVFKLSCDTLDLKTEFVKTIQKTFNMQNRIRILKDAGKAATTVRKISEYAYGGKRLEASKSKIGSRSPTRTLRRWQSAAGEASGRKESSENGTSSKAHPPAKRTDTV